MCPVSRWLGSALILVASLDATGAWGAPLFSETGSDAPVIPGACRVALFHHAGHTSALFSIDVDTQTADGEFAWVIPVPTEPQVGAADPLVVAELDALSAPLAVYDEDRLGASPNSDAEAAGCGCSAQAADDLGGCGFVDSTDDSDGDVLRGLQPTQLVSRTSFGQLEVVVLSSGAGDDLGSWLTDHGFSLSADFASRVQPYVDAGWYFVATRFDTTAGAGAQALALRLDYADPDLTYPTRALALTPTQVAHVVLTVMIAAEHQAIPEHHHVTLQDLAPEGWTNSAEYLELLERELISDARLAWVVESAQAYHRVDFLEEASPSWALADAAGLVPASRDARLYVTRLTTMATRLGAAASADLTLTLDPDAADVPNTVDLRPAAALNTARPGRPTGTTAIGLSLALALCVRRWRRR